MPVLCGTEDQTQSLVQARQALSANSPASPDPRDEIFKDVIYLTVSVNIIFVPLMSYHLPL